MAPETYAPLTPETIPARLGGLPALRALIGPDPATWRAVEVGDGNLNLVFIVSGPSGKAVAKQALPYVRLVGESWPLPLERAWFEWNALTREAARAPGSVPTVHHFDREQALLVMEFLDDHVILRKSLIAGVEHPGLASFLGLFCARTLFRSTDLSLPTAEKKADVALFAGNVALMDITEALVFTDPYRDAPMNRHTPGLEALVAELRADEALKVEAQHLKWAYTANAEALLHGDLHTGSIMAVGDRISVIDPEFASYGPIGFDVGMLIANFLMAYHAQSGHEAAPGERDGYREWILGVAEGIWTTFVAEFARLWREERRGILYPAALYEDQGQPAAAERALADRLGAIWVDALGFCGVEIHRRILGLAHNADFETIAYEARRAACEAPALRLGRALVHGRRTIGSMADVCALARAEDAAGR
ncbi:S-methyl-5-thioribose kinase [Amaricoccus sp.]|uniref:S-methyl-5-thioribose kinase n=1 Tax=Amaricoccus sp. TaxID=1872485 RepID=UPI001B3FAC07|nr:S-methyl-5-thioribose kinase [Amaricoccus sp.]MBP7242958.1 S-methyl-5-thioribose kinase [Amaricoccus sp.]